VGFVNQSYCTINSFFNVLCTEYPSPILQHQQQAVSVSSETKDGTDTSSEQIRSRYVRKNSIGSGSHSEWDFI
jgi:hypothetical protein